MGIFEAIFHPVQYVLGRSMRGVFDQEVRADPVIVGSGDLNETRAAPTKTTKTKRGNVAGGTAAQQGFKPQYYVPLRAPRNDAEAQRLYNHVRTIAFYLDAIPLLGRRLPFNIGLDSILGFIPVVGDAMGLVLALYAVFLCSLFGLPITVLALMAVNVVVDCTVGLIPIVGDALDVAFKANLRNLRLLEDHMIGAHGRCRAGTFSLLVPPSNVFMPPSGSPAFSMPARQSAAVPADAQTSSRVGGGDQSSGFLPDGSVKTQYTSTTSRRGGKSAYVGQDFRKGTIDKRGVELDGAKPSSSVSIVPTEIFTTMRYEKQGTTLAKVCSPLFPSRTDARWHRSEQILLFDRHLNRLLDSATSMRAAFPHEWQHCHVTKTNVKDSVSAHLERFDEDVHVSHRVRVAVHCDGHVDVSSAALPSSATTEVKTVRLDTFALPVDQLSEQRRILFERKTGERHMYDQARERVHATLGTPLRSASNTRTPCFDVLMCARMEPQPTTDNTSTVLLTESSIANIIVAFDDGRLHTPRQSHQTPLLSGVMRQELLDLGLIQEHDVIVDTLLRTIKQGQAKIYLCNALRGIIPVRLLLE